MGGRRGFVFVVALDVCLLKAWRFCFLLAHNSSLPFYEPSTLLRHSATDGRAGSGNNTHVTRTSFNGKDFPNCFRRDLVVAALVRYAAFTLLAGRRAERSVVAVASSTSGSRAASAASASSFRSSASWA